VVRARVPAGREGFTLVEVVVAIVMLSFGVLASASLTAALMKSNRGISNRTRAIEIAREKVEDLQSKRYTEITSGSDAVSVRGRSFSRAWSVAANSPIANTKTITMTVTWTDRQGGHTISTQTIRGQ
jgi:prepilin-type N-terminal cleavage/methylation domain-containing protein